MILAILGAILGVIQVALGAKNYLQFINCITGFIICKSELICKRKLFGKVNISR